MKKFTIAILFAALVMYSVPAFAGYDGGGPGDGGFFTKLLDGALGDSWEEGTSDKGSGSTK